jgi:hypothetical protein
MPVRAELIVQNSSVHAVGTNLGLYDFDALPRIGEDIDLGIGGEAEVTGILHFPVLVGDNGPPRTLIYIDTH